MDIRPRNKAFANELKILVKTYIEQGELKRMMESAGSDDHRMFRVIKGARKAVHHDIARLEAEEAAWQANQTDVDKFNDLLKQAHTTQFKYLSSQRFHAMVRKFGRSQQLLHDNLEGVKMVGSFEALDPDRRLQALEREWSGVIADDEQSLEEYQKEESEDRHIKSLADCESFRSEVIQPRVDIALQRDMSMQLITTFDIIIAQAELSLLPLPPLREGGPERPPPQPKAPGFFNAFTRKVLQSMPSGDDSIRMFYGRQLFDQEKQLVSTLKMETLPACWEKQTIQMLDHGDERQRRQVMIDPATPSEIANDYAQFVTSGIKPELDAVRRRLEKESIADEHVDRPDKNQHQRVWDWYVDERRWLQFMRDDIAPLYAKCQTKLAELRAQQTDPALMTSTVTQALSLVQSPLQLVGDTIAHAHEIETYKPAHERPHILIKYTDAIEVVFAMQRCLAQLVSPVAPVS
jgi:hypothetical protein